MTEKRTFTLINDQVRRNAISAIADAPEGYTVTVGPRKRSLDQNAHFHSLCSDLAKSPLKWAGKRRTSEEWKALLISAHAVATGIGGEVIPGLEGEFVAIRESSAAMSVSRAASLIDYTLSFCATNGVELIDTRHSGFARAA